MKLTPKLSVVSEFREMYAKATQLALPYRADLGRMKTLRASQLPFCAISYLINYRRNGTNRHQDFMMTFYVDIGTAVHSLMQRYLPQVGKFVADYECLECGTHYKFSTKSSCCGFPCKYEELEVDHSGLVGHVDGLFQDKNGKYWVIDFKTTSLVASPKKVKDPGQGYLWQIRSYAVLLERQYGIEIQGTVLWFIPRDNPKNAVPYEELLTDDIRYVTDKNIKKWRKRHDYAFNTDEVDPRILKWRCKDPFCVCNKMSEKELLKHLNTGFPLPISENI